MGGNASKFAENDRLTHAELEELKRVFQTLAEHKAPKRTIDRSTFLEYFPLEGRLGEEFFNAFDTDHSEGVDLHQFLAGVALLRSGSTKDKIAFLFEVFNFEHDDGVSKPELKIILWATLHSMLRLQQAGASEPASAALDVPDAFGGRASLDDDGPALPPLAAATVGQICDELVKDAFDHFDEDHSGKLSVDQFQKWATRRPFVADAICSVALARDHHPPQHTGGLGSGSSSLATSPVATSSVWPQTAGSPPSASGRPLSLAAAATAMASSVVSRANNDSGGFRQSNSLLTMAAGRGALDTGTSSSLLHGWLERPKRLTRRFFRSLAGSNYVRSYFVLDPPFLNMYMKRPAGIGPSTAAAAAPYLAGAQASPPSVGASGPAGSADQTASMPSHPAVRTVSAVDEMSGLAGHHQAPELAIFLATATIDSLGGPGVPPDDPAPGGADDDEIVVARSKPVEVSTGKHKAASSNRHHSSQHHHHHHRRHHDKDGHEATTPPQHSPSLDGPLSKSASSSLATSSGADSSQGGFAFQLTYGGGSEQVSLIADSAAERDAWVSALRVASKHRRIQDHYNVDYDELLGRGAFSTVHPGEVIARGSTSTAGGGKDQDDLLQLLNKQQRYQSEERHRLVAVKLVRKVDLDAEELEQLRHEVSVLRMISTGCRNVVVLLDLFESPDQMVFVMERLGTNLLTRMEQRANEPGANGRTLFSEAFCRSVLRQLLTGLAFIHSVGICHRDVKPNNLCVRPGIQLANDEAEWALVDFGYAVFVGPVGGVEQPAGSVAYFSPELVAGESYNTPIDVWAAGVILYRLATGQEPFDHRDDTERLLALIREARYQCSQPCYTDLGDQQKDLLRSMLRRNPTERITATKALEHPWIQAGEPKRPPKKGRNIKSKSPGRKSKKK